MAWYCSSKGVHSVENKKGQLFRGFLSVCVCVNGSGVFVCVFSQLISNGTKCCVCVYVCVRVRGKELQNTTSQTDIHSLTTPRHDPPRLFLSASSSFRNSLR
jgi:hypothetical protein